MSSPRRARLGRTREAPIVFYDGDCRSCTFAARMVMAADTAKKLRSATLDSPDADRYLGRLSKKKRYGMFHLYRDGHVLSGPDAIGPLLELLPPLRAAGRFLGRSDRARDVSARLYWALAGRRGLIGRLLPSVRPPSR